MRLGHKVSDFVAAIYIIGTLFIRFLIEPQLNGHYGVSIALGVFSLVFLWALIQSKVLNPSLLAKDKEA